ncbi:hypothetical protein EBOKLHFM_00143 [Klebsiella phage KP13-26]|nr:hypothetical protein EBOKLHFM_00143 [Klebsiella phage KP13-26]
MPNMSYCMFENTSNDMQDIINKMYEDDFTPSQLSPRERRAYDALWEQAEAILDRLSEIEAMEEAEEEEDED